MFVVGLTGGIGSGKTAIANLFHALDIDVIDADLCARLVVEKNSTALNNIRQHFGESILLADGALDRSALRKRIFSDEKERLWLQALLHPLIYEEILKQLHTTQSAYVVLVSPLLFESKQDLLCDDTIAIDVPENIQLARASQRDKSSVEEIKKIVSTQLSREERKLRAKHLIDNAGTLELAKKQVIKLDKLFRTLAQNKSERT